ncbi:hypothetical protein MPTK1_6g19180 [Marchantia polymorpha subsp. ruderalis]|uniref:Glycosyltransferase family 92 protein n=2 Tax=Marchantia polymorpha TaxID=3197 RepID=A0AAF6BTQ0_MARPO|nr:hypothetical protein MARPO_0045s0145 [Marchantia polymorpha]BBN15384.1 hypothetical protein Mp_6g19180 [Marchantia polymorpha subsp. ruderalis]|eukprot:PTQ39504.1 hypothetical protein MARPO_0045s0145 [Marchantia polymorpha]
MGRNGRMSMPSAHQWEFWRLVFVIFSASFIVQILVLLSVVRFTDFSLCNDPLNSPVAEIRYQIEGTFEPSTRDQGSLFPPSSSLHQQPPTYSKACSHLDTNFSRDSSPYWTCADEEVTRELSQPDDKSTSALGEHSLQPLSIALHPFVKFSTYRLSMNTILVVGLSSAVYRAFDKPVHDCTWHQEGKDLVTTDAKMIYVKWDEGRMPYVPAIVNCTFPTAVGADASGGTLQLSISAKPNRLSLTGTVAANVYEERKGEVEVFNRMVRKLEQGGAAALPYKYAYCGPPMFGRIRPDWILGWLTYHYRLYEGMEGKVRFFFYNVGALADEGTLTVLEPFIKAGVVEIVNVLEIKDYTAHYRGQVLFVNDCLHRTRFIAQWTLFHDFDEFIYVPQPNSLQSLLKQHEDKAWLTFASLPASWKFCTELSRTVETRWPVERMVCVEEQPECRYKQEKPDPWLCTGPLGRRKYVVNPRKVFAAGIHYVTKDSGSGGVDLNGTLARLHHYHGALATFNYLCNGVANFSARADNTSEFSRYIFNDDVATETSKARDVLRRLLGEA